MEEELMLSVAIVEKSLETLSMIHNFRMLNQKTRWIKTQIVKTHKIIREEKVLALFGEIHPSILKKIEIKTESLVGFEIFVDNIKQNKKSLNDQKGQFKYSDFQKSERDFAFILNKDFQAQELIK